MQKENIYSILLLFAMMSWGLSWVASKIMVAYLSVFELACIRFLIVALSFLPIMWIFKISFQIHKQALKGVLLVSGFNVVYSCVFFFGLGLGNAGNAGVITTTLAPIFSSLIGSFIYKVRLRKSEKIGLLFGFIAGGFLIGFSGLANLYNCAFLLAALLWCFVTLSSKTATRHINAIALNFYSSAISGVVFLPSFAVFGIPDFSSLDSRFWICMLTVAIVSTTFGTSIFYKGIEILGFSKGASFTLLVPLFALIFAYIFLGEIPSIQTIIGGSIAVFAIYLINFYRTKS